VVESCIKYINTFGMNHQGIFRIGGSHADINKFEEEFEAGRDPFSILVNGHHVNSVAGVLKSYFRKLGRPLISEAYFDQFINITRNHQPPSHVMSVNDKNERDISGDIDFVVQIRNVINQWSEPHKIVTKYLLSFIQDLAQFSEETQMDTHNLAVCFGPTLCPIPHGKDIVQYTNLVNNLIMNLIIFCHDIFNYDLDGPEYKPVELDDFHDAEMGPLTENVKENLPEASNLMTSSVTSKSSLSSSSSSSQNIQAVVEHDFISENPKVLSLKEGDSLILHSQASADWWRGSRGGVTGLIAAKYVKILDLEEITEKDLEQPQQDEGLIKELQDKQLNKQLSFDSNRRLWEHRTKNEGVKSVEKAPDLLKDVLDKSQEIEVTLGAPSNEKKSGKADTFGTPV